MTSLPLGADGIVARSAVPLSGYTTLRLGGPAAKFVAAGSAEDVAAAVRAADGREEPVLVLGGGSNLVVADEGFDGTVVQVANSGSKIDSLGDGRVALTVEAGEDWDAVVCRTVEAGLGGLECLSGIPGSVGATPVQNVGAYGIEVSQLLISVDLLDRVAGEIRTLGVEELGLGYRTSVLKRDLGGVLSRIAARIGADVPVPQYPAGVGATKLSAAWLIERAGFSKGYPGSEGRVALSGKHTLALTNRGTATTQDLLALAREVRDGVQVAFGVELQPEPVLVGCIL
jgi:UDP-N-acetylenolpyruvoylglucosamine reductase